MSNKQCKLPAGSYRKAKKGYEEVVVPAPKMPAFASNEKLIQIADLPKWAQPAFSSMSIFDLILFFGLFLLLQR